MYGVNTIVVMKLIKLVTIGYAANVATSSEHLRSLERSSIIEPSSLSFGAGGTVLARYFGLGTFLVARFVIMTFRRDNEQPRR
jgi:hypothetical protein